MMRIDFKSREITLQKKRDHLFIDMFKLVDAISIGNPTDIKKSLEFVIKDATDWYGSYTDIPEDLRKFLAWLDEPIEKPLLAGEYAKKNRGGRGTPRQKGLGVKKKIVKFKAIPNGFENWNGGVQCDMLIGPCACKATHSVEEQWVKDILQVMEP